LTAWRVFVLLKPRSTGGNSPVYGFTSRGKKNIAIKEFSPPLTVNFYVVFSCGFIASKIYRCRCKFLMEFDDCKLESNTTRRLRETFQTAATKRSYWEMI
jgi:hypothetical protein